MIDEELTYSVIGAFFAVQKGLGNGFLENVYQSALEYELRKRGHAVTRELPVAIYYDGIEIARQRLDLVVDGRLIVEAKATKLLHNEAKAQLYSYLRATNLEVGLLLHFNGRGGDFYRLELPNSRKDLARGPINPSSPTSQ